jgi:hypothetical protein
MVSDRIGTTAVVILGQLYVIGGIDSSVLPENSIERAIINADGSLGGFATYPGSSATAREFQTTPVIGPYVYVLGGSDPASGGNAVGVYRAFPEGSGALGSFELVPSISLSAQGPITAAIGGYIYAFGFDAVVQRAGFDVTSSLGSFVTVPDVALSRFAETSAVVGDHFYVAGGAVGRNPLNSVEQAGLK